MSLRFFSDQCVPQEIVEMLRQGGHEVLLLRETLPTDSPDSVVISKAQQLGAILLSLNGDFADIVAFPPSSYAGNIAIQLHNHPEVVAQLMRVLLAFLGANPEQSFYRGKLLIVEPHRIRIRE